MPIKHRTIAVREVGPISFLVLLAVCELPTKNRNATEIWKHVSEEIDEIVDTAQIYITLKRLEGCGLLTSVRERSPNSTSHWVRRYTITQLGKKKIEQARTFYLVLGKAATRARVL